jgi:hypothetical protein
MKEEYNALIAAHRERIEELRSDYRGKFNIYIIKS